MPELALHLLGPPRFELDGEPLRFNLRKVEGLFIYLAVVGKPFPRETLIALFYPELERERAQANFRRTLSVLKSAIGIEWLLIDDGGIAVPRREGLRIDVTEFRRLSKDYAGEPSRLPDAAGLYRGEFLSGFSLQGCPDFDEWCFFEREGLEREYASVLRRLVAYHTATGEFAQGIEYGRTWVSLDPLDEEAHRDLMRLYALSGERSAALRQYEQCRSAIGRGLGREPGEETKAVRDEISSGRLTPAPTGGQPPPPDVPEVHKRPAESAAAEHPNNLPQQLTSYIGREVETAEILSALGGENIRIFTLTGPGGIGKTRLALHVASRLLDRFEHGVFFVDLASLARADQVTQAITAALKISETAATLENSGGGQAAPRTPNELLADFLGNKAMLLVLDTFEHVLEAGPVLVEIAASCPHVKFIATSRESLNISGEQVYGVPPLELSAENNTADLLGRSESARLFAQRATAVEHGFEITEDNVAAVAAICARLDGLPLAIELAAAKIRLFSPEKILERLDHRLSLLDAGPRDLPRRQQALRYEIDWSYDLLDDAEKTLFRRISVFAGGCTVEAAEAVCGDRGVGDVAGRLFSLFEKSLLTKRDTREGPRFTMLQTIREYAAEMLIESGEEEEWRRALSRHCIELAEASEIGLRGPEWRRWFEKLDEDVDNIRLSLEWLQGRGERVEGLRLAGAMGWFWFRRARYAEGQRWLELYLGESNENDPPAPRAKALYYLGLIQACTGRAYLGNPEVARRFEESARLWRLAGDRRGLALALASYAYVRWGWDTLPPKNDADTRSSLEALTISRQTGDLWTIAFALIYDVSHKLSDSWEARRETIDEAIALSKDTGDPYLACLATASMGEIGFNCDDYPLAQSCFLEALRIAREIDDKWHIFEFSGALGATYNKLDRPAEANEIYRDGLRLAVDVGSRGYFHWLIGGLDYVAQQEGRYERATRLWGAALALLGIYRTYDQVTARFPPKMKMGPRKLVLDRETGAAEWEIGQAMTVDEAIAYALSDD